MPAWVCLGGRGDPLSLLVFQPVAEPKRGKVRLQLDVLVVIDDIDEEWAKSSLSGAGSSASGTTTTKVWSS